MFKKVPHTYVIIFTLIVLAAVATWFVPAGEFERQTTTTDSGKKVEQIVPGSFQRVEQSPVQRVPKSTRNNSLSAHLGRSILDIERNKSHRHGRSNLFEQILRLGKVPHL